MKQISDTIRGTLRIEAFGAYPEELLNCAAADGIELWDAENSGNNTIRFSIYEKGLEALKKAAEDCTCSVTVIQQVGGSTQIRFAKRRAALLVSLTVVVLMLAASSLFIWQIDVRGNSRLSRGEILRALDECGVCVGTYWPGISADAVRSRMMQLLPDVGWMTVNVSGSRAVVLITERSPVPEIYDESADADLIASKSGIVRRVSVLAGKSEVQPGQAVTEGETLVSGTLDSITGGSRTVRSRGSVMADTWYEINAVRPEEEELKNTAGISRCRFALQFGKKRINLYISSGKAIDGCDKIISEYTIGAEGLFAMPVRLVRETFVPYESSYGADRAEEEMTQRLMNELESRVEGQILRSSVTESRSKGLYVLTLRAHCMENITETREMYD